MATPSDFMGMGAVNSYTAERLGVGPPIYATLTGQTAGGAQAIGGTQFLTMITGSNSGSGLRLPQVVGDEQGCLVGDLFTVTNLYASVAQIYINNNAAGSAVTVYINAQSLAGTTGFSLLAGHTAMVRAVTPSTWVGLKTST